MLPAELEVSCWRSCGNEKQLVPSARKFCKTRAIKREALTKLESIDANERAQKEEMLGGGTWRGSGKPSAMLAGGGAW